MNIAMKWIDDVRGQDSLRAAARKAGVTAAKLIRQVNDDALAFETVRAVSRAYGRAVVNDLIATGHLTIEDAGVEGVERALQAASDEELVLEVGRRLDVTPASIMFDAPVDQAITSAGNVTRLRHTQGLTADDLIDDAGNVEYYGQAAQTGEHEADRHTAADEAPEDR
ncbi:hypothetical protein [Leucobacter luti]|uniref:hypothetical protein n=1 Tax=Leucobacter luti TaxID=340320 RepID=UPI003D06A7DF